MAEGKGYHFFVELWGCDPERIGQTQPVEEALLRAVEVCGASYVSHNSHQFSPHGVTCMVLIKESHIAVHTWPEDGYAALDIFTCSSRLNTADAVAEVRRLFGATEHELRVFERGNDSLNTNG